MCTDSVPLGGAYFGMGTGNILLDNVRCSGRESSLLECNANPIGQPDGSCDHSEDAGVRCQGMYSVIIETFTGTEIETMLGLLLSIRIHTSDLDVIKMCHVSFESRTLPIWVPDCVCCTQ